MIGSCRIGPIDPKPLMTPAASAAWRRLPTSIAQAPESSESGPIAVKPIRPSSAMNSTGEDKPTSHISVVNTRQPAVIQKITGVRREPGMRSDQIAGDDHAAKPIQSNAVDQ